MADLTVLGIILILAGVLLFLLEMSTPGFFVAVPATVLLVLGAIALIFPHVFESWVSIPILLLVSMVSLYLTMKAYEKLAPPDTPSYGAIEALIGAEGFVVKTLEPTSIAGKVKINRREWAATAEQRLPVGTKVEVIKAEGVHLDVREVKDYESPKASEQ